MITLLTPSKTMDFVSEVPDFVTETQPLFLSSAQQIRRQLAKYSEEQLQEVMNVSKPLAHQVHKMYTDPQPPKAALWAYTGDVFKGFQANTLNDEQAAFAQNHLLIASGVYGVLRPFDIIEPYRLEMRAKLPVDGFSTVCEFWSDQVKGYITGQVEGNNEICILSSEEYAKPVLRALPKNVKIVTPAFYDLKTNGTIGQVPIYNKMMRGVMAKWIVVNAVDSLQSLHEFSAHGYSFSPKHSTPARPVFHRAVMTPLVFDT